MGHPIGLSDAPIAAHHIFGSNNQLKESPIPRKKATSTFSLDSVQYTTRAIPSKARFSPYREIADKLLAKGENGCAENLPDKNAALRVVSYMRAAGQATRMSEVDGAGWCVWNRGKKGKK